MRRWLSATVAVLGTATLIGLAWPRPADADIRQAYAQLRTANVPVRVLGWLAPTGARADVQSNAYTLTVEDRDLGELTIHAVRAGAPPPAAVLQWQEGDVSYSVATAASVDPRVLAPRVVSLDDATRQIEGATWDSPLLYLFYLPLLLLALLTAVWCVADRGAT